MKKKKKKKIPQKKKYSLTLLKSQNNFCQNLIFSFNNIYLNISPLQLLHKANKKYLRFNQKSTFLTKKFVHYKTYQYMITLKTSTNDEAKQIKL